MDEETKTEMVESEPQESVKAPTMEDIQAELERTRAALKKANGEAAKYRKTAEQVEQERKDKEEAEMTALEKANKRAADLEAELNRTKRESLQKEIAAKVGLPARLATRLQGETPEEMEADAKAILEDLPKPPAPVKPGPGILPANPGANGSSGETREQRRARLGL
jgi:anthranilate phosphoribosyltransferase